jgi:hypothetical protein
MTRPPLPTRGNEALRYFGASNVIERLNAADVPHPFQRGSTADHLVRVIAAQAAGWEFVFDGHRWAAAGTDPERRDRSVVVDASLGLSTDLNAPDRPRPWLPGTLVAGYVRGHEALIQVPLDVVAQGVANVALALVALGVLPDADGTYR